MGDFRSETGRRLKGAARWLLFAAVVLASAGMARAGEFHFTQANDFFSGNSVEDDLYTFSLAFEFHHKAWSLRAFENAFTDHENGLRFDESFFLASRGISFGSWMSRVEVGLVYVGKGLFGQSFQNTIHALINDRPVDLTYVDNTRLEPVAGFEIWRAFAAPGSVLLVPRVRVRRADDFKQSITALALALRKRGRMSYFLGLGWSLFDTEYPQLEPWLKESAVTWEAGVTFADAFTVKWLQNEYGLGRRYLQVGYVWKLDRS